MDCSSIGTSGRQQVQNLTTMKAFVASALAAVAAATPEADPQVLLTHGAAVHVAAPLHGAAHSQVYSKVHHANGAVVPDDTLSVKVAKAQHLNAKATAYLNKPLVHALLPQVAAAPAEVAKPVVSYHGLTTPLVHSSPVTYTTGYPYVNTHLMGKREAEAEADPALVYTNAALTHPVVHNNVLAYNGLYNNFNGLYNYNGLVHSSPVTYTTGYPLVNGHYLGKREAEAEADPALLYGNFYNTGYHGVYNGLYNHGVYSAPLTYTHHAAAVPVVKKVEVTAPVVTKTAVAPVVSYGYPYAYNTHMVAKREAEADPLTVFPAVPTVSAVPAVSAIPAPPVYKTSVVSATHGYSLGNTYTYGHNAAFYNAYPYNTYSGLYY